MVVMVGRRELVNGLCTKKEQNEKKRDERKLSTKEFVRLVGTEQAKNLDVWN